MNSQNTEITNIFYFNKIKCKQCYIIFSQTEYYKQSIINKISDAYNGEYDHDLENEFKYFIKQINLQCRHNKCIII